MIDLYTVPTTNGQKASIMLEETALSYKAHTVNLMGGDHQKPDFLAINPVAKCPAIVDHDGPGGNAFSVYETTAIVFYLAEKTGILKPRDIVEHTHILQWASIVASGFSPAFTGLFVFNTFAPEKIPFALDYLTGEAHRYFKVMEKQLAETTYLTGDAYTIADVLAYPVAATSGAGLEGGLDPYPNVVRWRDLVGARPAVQKGMAVPKN